nr:hypothetical protein [Tanacetum cinerariifolium]
MLLSPQHDGFGDLKLRYKIMCPKIVDHTFVDPQDALKDQGYFNNGCSRHMTGNISYLTDFKEHDGVYVAFKGGAKGGKITGKGTIKTATTNETSRILKRFITEIENLVDKKVKIIRCDNGTKFKNRVMNEFYEEKDSKLPTTFWAEVVNTACYVQNKVLVVKPHFKTSYELFKGRSPALSFMRPFECHVTILNTLDQLGKFNRKSDEGIFVGNSTISKAFRVYNTRTRKVKENNLFPPLDNPELTIRRRSHTDPTFLNNSKMAAEGNGDLPVPDLRTMEELCQPSLNGRGGPIAPIVIQATNFGLKNDMIQQVQNSCQFHGLPGGTFMKRRPEECYDLIENMTAHHNDWDTSAQRSESSSSITSSSDTKIVVLKAEMTEINKNLMRVLQPPLATLKTFMLQEPTKTEYPILNSEPVVAPIIEPIASPVSAPKPNLRPSIPYPSRLHDQKLRDKANDQREKIFQIFKDLNFNISFADALILMPKFGPSIKSLLTNKDNIRYK